MAKICVIFLFLYSCHSYPSTDLIVWNYDDFIKKDVKMSDIADEMTIIQPDSIDFKGARIVHASSFFLAYPRINGIIAIRNCLLL